MEESKVRETGCYDLSRRRVRVWSKNSGDGGMKKVSGLVPNSEKSDDQRHYSGEVSYVITVTRGTY